MVVGVGIGQVRDGARSESDSATASSARDEGPESADAGGAAGSSDGGDTSAQGGADQELLNDWKDAKTVRTFSFFGQKNNIILRDEDDGSFVVGSKGKNVCVARQFKTIWFIASGDTQKQTKANKGKSFGAARSAFPLICKTIFDALEENNV